MTPPTQWDPRVKLDPSSELQCTTCHDPHDDQFGDFLVVDNIHSFLCRQCHQIAFFDQTPHALSNRQWNGAPPDPWPHTDFPDVSANACLNCHLPHHAGGLQELLTSSVEEDVCFVCHDGNVASFNMRPLFQKPFTHPVQIFQGVHQAGESPLQASTHVECVDCHNPHRARLASASPPFVKGVLQGVSGIDAAGNPLDESSFEYEICFKCHADHPVAIMDLIHRQIPSGNARKDFSTASPSYHPVEAAGKNPDVPSLLSPLTPASLIYCSDCHNNDTAQPNQIGSNGPHGSNHEFLLAKQYRTGDNVSESPTSYALCYGCHNRSSILNDVTFTFHKKHVADERTPCSVCHDAHGIDLNVGNPMNNAHLINFDLDVVSPEPIGGRLEYQSSGPRAGQCFLSCHGEIHNPKQYP
ncbi:MAG: hypothetical protein NTW86_26365 [Candidatus Sumerlaeota bacterium]|nr:hypothetical protein [Candidatus Sumerlaeota bacterium]